MDMNRHRRGSNNFLQETNKGINQYIGLWPVINTVQQEWTFHNIPIVLIRNPQNLHQNKTLLMHLHHVSADLWSL